MKTKIKNTPARKTSTKSRLKSRKIVLVHPGRPVLRHFKLVHHKHTGKLIHLKHTSHIALTGILVVTGFFLYVNSMMATAVTSSGSVTVGAIVPGDPPTVGASITSPINGANLSDKSSITVSGTCPEGNYIVVSNNSVTAGSAVCSSAGSFSLQVQIETGTNVLRAQNYDSLNQSGPNTPAVTVNVTKTQPVVPPPTVPTIDYTPVIPVNPSHIAAIEPSFTSCDEYKADPNIPTGGQVKVAVVCAPRLFTPDTPQVFGILIWGGEAPYVINIDWKNDDPADDQVFVFDTPGYKTITYRYAFPGTYKVEFRLTDKNQQKAAVETAVQVSGPVEKDDVITNIVKDIENSSWFETPVPFYLTAVAITLGFWGGDIFARKFGATAFKPKRRRSAS